MYIEYGLEDPRDSLYHYIGITDDVYERFIAHIKGSGGNIHKNGWIFECRQANIMIVMRELERVETLVEALERERYWIGYYMDLGHPLKNMTIAKSILQGRATLEKLAQGKQEERIKPMIQVSGIDHMQQALQLWQQGIHSHRKIAAIMQITESAAYTLLIQLDVDGFIVRRKRAN